MKRSATLTIGIDLGGTQIKGGLCDDQHGAIVWHSTDTQAGGGVDHVIRRIVALIDELVRRAGVKKGQIRGVGIGAPGPLSVAAGVIHSAPNLPGWVNVPLRQLVAEATGLPVVVENDANAAAYGEFVAGAGRQAHSLVLLTLGTGIGGGIVLEGRLWRGADDAAGEIGHMVIAPDGRPCSCGQQGCLERYASASAVAELFIEAARAGAQTLLREQIAGGAAIDAREVLRAGDQGCPLAVRIWEQTCRRLAQACVNLERVLSPELVLLGGGLAQAGERLLHPVRRHFLELRWKLTPGRTRIELATLGTQAGFIGAAALAARRGRGGSTGRARRSPDG